MASPNAGPVTGAELVKALQGGQSVWLTRSQTIALLAMNGAFAPRTIGQPTQSTGTEQIEALQGAARITLDRFDLVTFMASTKPEGVVPSNRVPGPLTGLEQIVGLQGGNAIAFLEFEIESLISSGSLLPFNWLGLDGFGILGLEVFGTLGLVI